MDGSSKKMLKILLKIIKIGLIIWLIILSPIIIFASIMGFEQITSQSPPQPVITYGEFPFRLEYEVNGERSVIEDVYKIKYRGISLEGGASKSLAWKGRFKKTRKNYMLLHKSQDDIELRLNAPVRLLSGFRLEKPYPYIEIFYKYENGASGTEWVNDETLEEFFGKDFKFRIISYEEAPTIKNEYVDKNLQDLIILIIKVIVAIVLLVWVRRQWKTKKINELWNIGKKFLIESVNKRR